MSKYTESNLNSMRKDDLVSTALKLANELEEMNAGPLTADAVKGKLLALKKEGLSVTKNREEKRLEYDLQVRKLESDKLKSLTELELKYKSEESVEAKEIDELFRDIEKRAKSQIEDLSFGLEVAENEANIKLAEITEKVTKAKENLLRVEEESKAKISKVSESYAEKISQLATKHEREMEQKVYDNSKAERDEDLDYFESMSENLGLTAVDTKEYESLVNYKSTDKEEVSKLVSEAVTLESSSIYAKENAKYSKLKTESESEIAILKNDITHLNSNLDNYKERVKELESRLKDVPAQIANAVASAKSEVTVNQDANKK